MKAITLNVQNIKCNGCASHIKSKLNELSYLSNIEVDIETNQVRFESTGIDHTDEIENILVKMGYPSADKENTLIDKSKSYVSCMIGRMNQ